MDLKMPETGELQKLLVVAALAAVAIGVIYALLQIAGEQDAIHDHLRQLPDAGQITALIAEATGIARKAAED
jgi:hypothetical protein